MIVRPLWPPTTPRDLQGALDAFAESVIKHVNRANDLSTYADNTAAKAGGLTDGMLYRTATGVVMVVYT